MLKRISVLLILMLVMPVASAEDSVSIIVAKTSMRLDRQFFAPSVAELQYRQSVAVLERAEDWLRVSDGEHKGWIHQSAVTSRQPAAASGGGLSSLFGGSRRDTGSVSGYSQDEVALAGKGFNQQVEKDFRRSDRRANYTAVDWLEKQSAPDFVVAEFAREGRLLPAAGSAAGAAGEER